MYRLLIVCAAVASAYAMVCAPDICQRVRCAGVTAEQCVGGTVQQNGGFCGCCPACINTIKQGERCSVVLLLGVPSTSQCEDGTYCDPGSATCQPTPMASKRQIVGQTCIQRLSEIKAGASNGLPLLGQYIPTCEADGSYSAKQCHGSVCYCVDPNGVKIQSYQAPIGNSANMDCSCARDQYAYSSTGMIGKLFSCTNYGSYQRYQCTGSVCFCADDTGNMKSGSPTVNIGNIGALKC